MAFQNPPFRIHLLAHANPATKDIARFGFHHADEYFDFIRSHLPGAVRLTCRRRLFTAVEDEQHGGRRDDRERIRDVQSALDDPATLAIVAANGGAYFTRVLPQLDFSGLARRRRPLWALGFSEMTTFVNLVASYRGGRGVYWLCPNYLAWKVHPAARAREAFGEFWRWLPALLDEQTPGNVKHLRFGAIHGQRMAGKVAGGAVRLMGGCLSVLVTMLGGPLARRLRPDGRWLIIEDINEAPYRVDRWLAALKTAGWFERLAGMLVGDFHTDATPQTRAVVELLKYHLPRHRNLPVVTTTAVGHVWPMLPVPINRTLRVSVRGSDVRLETDPSDRS